jgi:hypothetical protein
MAGLGGRRPNAGRKPGGHNRPRAAQALMQATQFPDDTSERPSAIQSLRELMAQYRALSETARKAGDMLNYRIWSKRVAEIAGMLLPHEVPRLAASWSLPAEGAGKAKTVFRLDIFDSQRRPLELPLPADAAPAASSEPADKPADAAAAEVLPPEPLAPASEAPPEESAPASDADAKLVWRRSQAWAAYFDTGRSRDRLWRR